MLIERCLLLGIQEIEMVAAASGVVSYRLSLPLPAQMGDPFFLVGPIQAGETFIISQYVGGQFSFLNTYTDNQNRLHYFLDSSFTGTNTFTPVSFQAQQQGVDVRFTDTSNSEMLCVQDSVAVPCLGGSPIQVEQTTYANWAPPVLFLVGVPYRLTTQGALFRFEYGAGAQEAQSNRAKGLYRTSESVLFLPSQWYFACSGGDALQNNSPLQTALSAYCASNRGATGCMGVQTQGWSNVDDCINGYPYVYCAAGTYCGSCQGPCRSTQDSCDFTGSGYSCRFDPEKAFTGQWWKQPWFVCTVIVLIAVFVIVSIVLLVWAARRRNTP